MPVLNEKEWKCLLKQFIYCERKPNLLAQKALEEGRIILKEMERRKLETLKPKKKENSMPSIQELAAEKVKYQNTVTALQVCNTYGLTLQEKVDLEISYAEAQRGLYKTQSQIDDYVKGG